MSNRINKQQYSRHFLIQAMDISETVLETARTARYNDFEIERGLSLERRNNYFEYCDSYWQLRPDIRVRVQFESVNLTRDFSRLGKFDLILCRNVTIYFTPETRYKILSTMVKMLNPQGVLLIGATEPISKYKKEFRTDKFNGCIYIKADKN
jgi:chemotaxis protein methyltransferase CheR